MPRVALDLNRADDRRLVKAEWRVAAGLVPGEPNQGLTAEILASPARLADHDDSRWEICRNIRESRSVDVAGNKPEHRREAAHSPLDAA